MSAALRWARRFPVLPVAFAAAFGLGRWLTTGDYISVLWRPLVVIVAVSVVAQLIATGATRSRHVGAVLAGILLAVLLDPLVGALMVLALGVPLVVRVARRQKPGAIDWAGAAAFLTVISVVALIFNAVSGVGRAAANAVPGPPAAPIAPAIAGRPDIYVLLLDEYPRSDTLTGGFFRYDNSSFTSAMAALGFEEKTSSHSNYNATTLTVSTLFNARHATDLVGANPGHAITGWDLQRKLNTGAALTWLHEAGYRITSIPSGVTSDDLLAADEVIDTGEINTFEFSVLRAGSLTRILPGQQAEWLYEQQRERIPETLRAFADQATAAAADPQPRFVFAHVMSPHAPVVFDADGGPVPPLPCLPQGCRLWDGREDPAPELTVGQVRHLNDLVLDAIRRIQAASPEPPVIVVMSDHGSRYSATDPDEMLRNLFLAATPGKPGLFPDDVTPINLIPRLLNAYAGTNLPMAGEESYQTELNQVLARGYLPLTPWPQT